MVANEETKNSSIKGKVLFLLQIIPLAALLYFADFTNIFSSRYLLLALILAFIFWVASLISLGLELYSPFLEPRKSHRLVIEGLYKYVRHPNYTSLVLLSLLLVISNFTVVTLSAFVFFLVVLDLSADYEETLLTTIYPEYKEYRKKVKKFIPYIF